MRQASKYSGGNPGRFAPYSLPLARIKKIMKKSSDDVKMISGEAPIVFAKACELFIKELTLRSWSVTVRGKRRMLHKDDIATAIAATDIFDFLLGMVSDSSRPLEYSGGIVGYSGGQGGGANLSDDA